jgi:two-component system sensor histidine kinase KdpD
MKNLQPFGLAHLFLALAGVAGVTATYVTWLRVANATTAAVSYLLIVFLVAAAAPGWVAIVTSIAAVFMLNFFFFPPVGALTITDPQNWIALFAFLAVSLIAGRLAALARGRQHDAVSRRDELARLFNLSRDILLTTDADAEAIACLARHLAARFQLEYVSICLPRDADFERFDAGILDPQDLVPTEALRRTLDDADRTSEGRPEAHVLTGRQEASSRC